MKKLLALLLSVLLVFGCCTTLFVSTAVAEEGGYSEKVIMQSDFHKAKFNSNNADTSRWYGGDALEYLDEDGDGTTDYAKVSYVDKTNNKLISSLLLLVPGREYELSFDMRIPEGSDYLNDGSATSAPEIYLTNAKYKTMVNGGALSELPYPFVGGAYSYAQDVPASNFLARRENVNFTWKVGDYSPVVRKGYSNFQYQVIYNAIGSTKEAPKDLNDEFANWTRVSVKFTAESWSDNVGIEVVNMVFKTQQDKELHIRNFVAKELNVMEDVVVYSSNFSKDANNVTVFEGRNVKNDSEFVKLNGDYVQLNSSANSDNSFSTAPFNAVPGNEYEITFKMRVPSDSASYAAAGENAPCFYVYESYKDKIANGKVNNAYSNASCYQHKSFASHDRKTAFVYNFGFGDYSRLSYGAFDSNAAKTVFKDKDMNSLYSDWQPVTIKFTAVDNAVNPGPVVVSFAIATGKLLDGIKLDIKDLVIKETPYNKASPVYNEVFVEDFEYAGTKITNVVNLYGQNNNVLTWGRPQLVTEANGNGYYSAYAMNQKILIPVNKGILAKYVKYDFSFDWKLTAGATGETFISSVAIVGFNENFADYKVIATGLSTKTLATGNWETFKFTGMVNNAGDFENYGILVIYRVVRASAAYSEATDTIGFDNIVIEEKGAATKGDFNLDNKVDLTDVALLAKYLAGHKSTSLEFIDSGFANYYDSANTGANLFDLVKLAQDVAGWSK